MRSSLFVAVVVSTSNFLITSDIIERSPLLAGATLQRSVRKHSPVTKLTGIIKFL